MKVCRSQTITVRDRSSFPGGKRQWKRLCKVKGGRRKACHHVKCKRTIPFRMLAEAGEKLGQVLAGVTIHTPVIPYVANVTAQYVTKAEDVKTAFRETGVFLRQMAAERGSHACRMAWTHL